MGSKGVLAILGLGALLTVAALGSFKMLAGALEAPSRTEPVLAGPSRVDGPRAGQIGPKVRVIAKPVSPETWEESAF